MVEIFFFAMLALSAIACIVEAWHEKDFPRDMFPWFAMLAVAFIISVIVS